MSPTYRNYCCWCIPFRFGVAIFSVLALALGGASLWTILRAGVTDSSVKIAAYIATVIYSLLGLSGLVSVVFKRYALAKNFSVLWWTVTILITVLSVLNMIFLATREKDEVKGICQTNLLQQSDKYIGGHYDPATLAEDVDSCYRYVLIIAGAGMAFQILVMLVGGWVASRYTSDVKHRKDGLAYKYGYGPVYAQSQPLPQHQQYQPAHPYTHLHGKGGY